MSAGKYVPHEESERRAREWLSALLRRVAENRPGEAVAIARLLGLPDSPDASPVGDDR